MKKRFTRSFQTKSQLTPLLCGNIINKRAFCLRNLLCDVQAMWRRQGSPETCPAQLVMCSNCSWTTRQENLSRLPFVLIVFSWNVQCRARVNNQVAYHFYKAIAPRLHSRILMSDRQLEQPLVERLIGMGVGSLDARHAAQLTPHLGEALQLVGRNPDGTIAAGPPIEWREYWSLDYHKYYYCCEAIGANQWDAPPCFRFREWTIDCATYTITITTARETYEWLDALIRRYPPDKAQSSLETHPKTLHPKLPGAPTPR